MKLLITVLLPSLFLSMAVSTSSITATLGAKKIIALKLSPTKAKLYRAANIAAFSVDAKHVLRPSKSYEMYLLPDNRVILRPAGWSEDITAYGGGYEEVPLPDGKGVAVCMCDRGADDCHFEKDDELGEDREDYKCIGTCGCSLYVVIKDDDEGIAEYETPGGQWFNF